MVQHCRRLSQSVARSSSRHQGHLAARSGRERARAADLLATERIEVDQEIFDNQLADIQRRMEAITNWATGSTQPGSSEREYRFSVGKKYEGKGGGFFYRDRKSVVEGKSVSVRVDLGGRRNIKKKKKRTKQKEK